MQEPPPFDPKAPDVAALHGAVARMLVALRQGGLDAALTTSPALPPPTSLVWGDRPIGVGAARWIFEAGSLCLELVVPDFGGDPDIDAMSGVLNQPAHFEFGDGSALSARLAHLRSHGGSIDFSRRTAEARYTLELQSWVWAPEQTPTFWLGLIDGPQIRVGNLTICGKGWSNTDNLRLEGNYDWNLVPRGQGRVAVLVDTKGRALDLALLGTDFTAMEFALGRRLRLDYLLAVDSLNQIAGTAGLEFGAASARSAAGRCPVADAFDLNANCGSLDWQFWAPDLFMKVSRALAQEEDDSPLWVAVATYVDSLEGNVHVNYLIAQVALEAFCGSTARRNGGELVSDPEAWVEFVRHHESEIRSFASDQEAARTLVDKVINARYVPSGSRVASALKQYGLDVPKAALKEVARRNRSAHEFVMGPVTTANAQHVADRLATIQTLLVAVIAKHVGFQGPIVGWEWVKGRRKIPEWWPWEARPEARRTSIVDARDNVESDET